MRFAAVFVLLCGLGPLPAVEDFELTTAIINTNPGRRHFPVVSVRQVTDRETGKRAMWVDLERSGRPSVMLSDDQMQQMAAVVETYIKGMSVLATREAGEQQDHVDFNGRHHWM